MKKLACNSILKKPKIMTSSPITSWQMDGEKGKQWQILFSWAPKSLWMLTAAMKWLTKVHIVKAMVFPVVVYQCENWTVKKDEHQRIDAFKMWCWRRLLRVPWTARQSSQSILKESISEYSLEGLMLKQKLQYFGHLMQRANLLEKTLMLGKSKGRWRRGWQRRSNLKF